VVTVVEPGGVADRAGLRRGDVILLADGREVRGPGDLVEATQDGRAAVLVRRNDGQLFVPLNMRR
jgi:S1-C subfamily serine protease